MLFRISSRDLSRADQQLAFVAAKISIRMKTSTRKVAQQILEDSRNVPPTVPQKTGALKRTGRVEPTDQGHAVVYGGEGVDYAEFVHDDLRPRKYTVPGSGPKFVETHALRREPEMTTVMSSDLQEFLNEEFA